MATGFEQARSVVAHLAGDDVAASRVELVLPETGVCGGAAEASACCSTGDKYDSCCGGPVADTSACCLDDEVAKAAGLDGCGCSTGAVSTDRPSFVSIA